MTHEQKLTDAGHEVLCYHPESDCLFLSPHFEADGMVEDVTGMPEFETRYAEENPTSRRQW